MGFGSDKLASAAMSDFLRNNGGYAVIDGGFATELERHGADLNDPLWSAKCLIDSPHLVRRVHLDYLEAGADIIITASYQATIQGFEAKGFSKEQSEALLQKSVQIACEARGVYYENNGNERSLRNFPILVAASVGSYGAYLADGSEYSGNYGEKVTLEYLKEFHRRRIQVLAESGADLIAFETIPNKLEAQVHEYMELVNFRMTTILLNGYTIGNYGEKVTLEYLKEFHRRRIQVLAESGADLIAFETIPNKLEAQAYAELLEEDDIKIPAWFSFSSKDGVNAVSGDSILECASVADSCEKVLAVGINCTPLSIYSWTNSVNSEDMIAFSVSNLKHYRLGIISKTNLHNAVVLVTSKPILIYPNSGETYDGQTKTWIKPTGVSDVDFISYVNKWHEAGAALIGGCCRTTPNTIRAIANNLSKGPDAPRPSEPVTSSHPVKYQLVK
ncbi:hypothetical protein C5167_043429 [Papaver somniferum]|uniref:Hcy-binding domain-containing protein n=1 Tax=Papaver somniferum TaxID=3469 RepID=A0A4Y7L5K9_PAPSO|nr:hypothetical protein C5167_043429 [Papaver somniferum]